MSVIVKNTETGQILLLCKGADSVIETRMISNPFKETVWKNIERYAMVGLRTLLLAEREISQSDYLEWKSDYEKTCSAV